MGLFITFEGVEGSGKSTQMEMLAEYLKEKSVPVVAVREPGGTAVGERVRAILLERPEEPAESMPISALTELFLYEACRAQLVEDVIAPALKKGATVLCDRYTDSTLAYQGYGRSLNLGAVTAINTRATGGLAPDVTILIDLDPSEGLRRATARMSGLSGAKEDRFEAEAIEFHNRVRDGFHSIAAFEPKRVHLVDGTGEIDSVHRSICDIIDKVLAKA